MAVQIARHRGARVIGTVAGGGHDALRAAGSDPVVYGDGLIERVLAITPEGVDAALDLIGTDEALDTSVALVQDHDRVVTIAGFTRGFELGIKVIGGAPGADPEYRSAWRPAGAVDLVDAGDGGRRRSDLPADRRRSGPWRSRLGHVHGKLVLIP